MKIKKKCSKGGSVDIRQDKEVLRQRKEVSYCEKCCIELLHSKCNVRKCKACRAVTSVKDGVLLDFRTTFLVCWVLGFIIGLGISFSLEYTISISIAYGFSGAVILSGLGLLLMFVIWCKQNE